MSNTDTDALVPVAWSVIAFGRVQKLVVRADEGEEEVRKWRRQDPHADMIPLYSPDTIERLTRERDEARRLHAEACRAYDRKNRSGCACKFEADGETVNSPCDAHRAWRDEAVARERDTMQWPVEKAVGRAEDMGEGYLRLVLDSDNDVCVAVWDGSRSASVEFCNPGGGGGGRSSRTRKALISEGA